ncbi:uncharacterized protein LOC116843825 isoform X1 [Odontomachus brunneus]|uniref:uncharacterized protein LOC116843825 isoform X1 n=1 Tax=Odontomachus brunneus TaxID=486640 RepID=UPI0013F2B014|nr:uncharacterized protein LOC116843825 isoform X1 [Odontomachus brunneus]
MRDIEKLCCEAGEEIDSILAFIYVIGARPCAHVPRTCGCTTDGGGGGGGGGDGLLPRTPCAREECRVAGNTFGTVVSSVAVSTGPCTSTSASRRHKFECRGSAYRNETFGCVRALTHGETASRRCRHRHERRRRRRIPRGVRNTVKCQREQSRLSPGNVLVTACVSMLLRPPD